MCWLGRKDSVRRTNKNLLENGARCSCSRFRRYVREVCVERGGAQLDAGKRRVNDKRE